MLSPELVVFDIAGTTIAATDEIPSAFRKAMAGVDIDLSDNQIREIRGKSKRVAIAELLTQHGSSDKLDASKVYEDFQEYLVRRYESRGVEAIEGLLCSVPTVSIRTRLR